ncbi:hypothetical protein CWS02_10495 [Enterobacter sp. EA-1]|nr:hypothetical protein CWS02_10495 [Enterobacter sp. EA-1]
MPWRSVKSHWLSANRQQPKVTHRLSSPNTALVERSTVFTVGVPSPRSILFLQKGMTNRILLLTPARAILDGHIVLSRRLAEAGHYPAIDIEASISRAMTALITEKHYARVRNFKQLLEFPA